MRSISQLHTRQQRLGHTLASKQRCLFYLKQMSSTVLVLLVIRMFLILWKLGDNYFFRIKEHQEDGNNSAVFSHLFDCSLCQTIKNLSKYFEILHSGTKYNVMHLESLFIRKYRPNLNKQMGPSKGTIPLRLF